MSSATASAHFSIEPWGSMPGDDDGRVVVRSVGTAVLADDGGQVDGDRGLAHATLLAQDYVDDGV
ncbi:hypothetical protein AB0C84_42595 [Actinomadura sp. NPDC048955]|uniref:hypothetical protein n=1 Tax=Actinomadura sp. NPDC048955 TaxID=3158228 RepID=UPI0033E0BBE4